MDERGTEILEAALSYAARGWAVLPLHNPVDGAPCSCAAGVNCDRSPGKHPRTANGLKDATTNPLVIRQWFTNWPAANIGLLTGIVSGFWALDIDPRHGGDDSLERLREIHGPIPHTVQSLTGGGGEHWFFTHPGAAVTIGNSVEALAPGLDVRGDGGYVVAPPSLHENGRLYAWEGSSGPDEVPLAEAPRWLSELVRGRPTRVPSPAERDAAGSLIKIAEGARNRSLFSLGGYMRRRGFSEASILAALLKTNAESCNPPMDPAEVRVIAWSAAKYQPGDPMAAAPSVQETPRRRIEDWPAFPLDESNKALHGLAGDVVRSIDPYTEADPVAILAHFLVFFGNVAGSSAHFEVSGREHPARLFAAIVGDSSVARKGTSEGQVRRLFENVDREWSKRRIVHGLASGEGLMRMLAPEGDATPDYRLLVVEPEMGAVLKAMSREGSILSMVIRQAWDTGNLEHRVSKSKEAIVVRDAHVSIVAHVTRSELVSTMDASQNTNGFANRFLWFLVRGSKELPDAPKVPAEIFEGLSKRILYAVEAAHVAQELQRSDEAAQLWRDWYHDLRQVGPGLSGLVASRAEAQVLRLSLLYALLDRSTKIEVVHLEAARSLFEFSKICAAGIFGRRLGNPLAQRILDELREANNGTLTRSELADYLGRNVSARAMDESISLLEELRFVEQFRPERPLGSKGRRPEALRLRTEAPE